MFAFREFLKHILRVICLPLLLINFIFRKLIEILIVIYGISETILNYLVN